MRRLGFLSGVLLGCGLLGACSGHSNGASKPVVAPTAHVVLRVGATASQPAVLINGAGFTLYVSRLESKGKQACTGQCLQVWPLVLLKPGASVTAGGPALARSAITKVTVPGGEAAAYHGYLLHTYVGDPAPDGEAGQGRDGQWSTITPAGRLTR